MSHPKEHGSWTLLRSLDDNHSALFYFRYGFLPATPLLLSLIQFLSLERYQHQDSSMSQQDVNAWFIALNFFFFLNSCSQSDTLICVAIHWNCLLFRLLIPSPVVSIKKLMFCYFFRPCALIGKIIFTFPNRDLPKDDGYVMQNIRSFLDTIA